MPYPIVLSPLGNDRLFYRIPESGSEFFYVPCTLQVPDNTVAVFFVDGQPADAFRAGSYTLSTSRLPKIAQRHGLISYGPANFPAVLYVISLESKRDWGWGTSQPAMIRDTDLGPVHVKAHGVFSIRIQSLSKFVSECLVAHSLESSDQLLDEMRKKISEVFSSVVFSTVGSIYDIHVMTPQIRDRLFEQVGHISALWGLSVTDVTIERISLPDSLQATLDSAAKARAVDEEDVRRMADLAVAQKLERQAQMGPSLMEKVFGKSLIQVNPVTFGGQPAGAASAGSSAPTTPPAPSPTPQMTAQWYVLVQGKQIGPLTQELLLQQISVGLVQAETLVWKPGYPSWLKAIDVPELVAAFTPCPPPPPPQV